MAAVPLQSPPAVPPARHILLSASAVALQPVQQQVGHCVPRGRPLVFENRADAIRCSTASRRLTQEGLAARPQGPRTRRLSTRSAVSGVALVSDCPEASVAALFVLFHGQLLGPLRLEDAEQFGWVDSEAAIVGPLRRKPASGWRARCRLCSFRPFPPLPPRLSEPISSHPARP